MTNAPAQPSIHIVDDDTTVVESLQLLLRSISRPALGWHSATAFLEEANVTSADVVLVDYLMPDMDGLAVVRRLHGQGIRPHFILMTGHADADFRRAADRLGLRKILDKPFSEAELAAALNLFEMPER